MKLGVTAWLACLRLGLLISSVGWGISFYFAIVPWEAAAAQLDGMGLGYLEYRPLLDYWLRMAAVAFGCIGIASGLACKYPDKFRGMIQLLGPFHLLMGITLIMAARSNQLDRELHPTFGPDIVFCLLVGILVTGPVVLAFVRGEQILS